MSRDYATTGRTPQKSVNRFFAFWRRLTSPYPSIKEPGAQRQAQLTSVLSLVLMLIILIATLASLIARGFIPPTLRPLFIFGIALILAYIFSRTPLYIIGAIILVVGFSTTGFAILFTEQATIAGALDPTIPGALIMASVLLPVWGLILLSIADIVVISILPAYLPNLTPTLAGTFAGNFTTLGILLVIAVIVRNAIERQRVAEIEKVNQELDETQASLKQNVEESTAELERVRQEGGRRSSQLQTIAEVARAISLVQEIEQLLINVANLISERFGFYHVGIFLVDELREYAVLRAASSPGGKRMLVRSHQLRIGQTGIVGYVSELGEPRYALDTGEDAVFFDNPELPETRSELGLPLKVGNRIIGVLDVQSKEQAAFSDEDIEAMSTLAAQVAVAIENARLFGETRRALTEVQTVYGQYLRQEWSHTAGEIRQIGYRQTPIGVESLAETVDLPEIQSAIKSGQTVVLNKESALAVPLKLRGEVIGVLDIRVPETSRQWEKDEIAAIEAVAERTALALENARLFEQTSRRADRERTVSEITTKIRSTADPQSMLQIALQELKRVLGARDIQIRPYAPEQTAEKESISGRRKRLTSKPQ